MWLEFVLILYHCLYVSQYGDTYVDVLLHLYLQTPLYFKHDIVFLHALSIKKEFSLADF